MTHILGGLAHKTEGPDPKKRSVGWVLGFISIYIYVYLYISIYIYIVYLYIVYIFIYKWIVPWFLYISLGEGDLEHQQWEIWVRCSF